MSKTLTEQWREGTLPQGYYYIVANTEQKHKVIFYLPERNTEDEARLDLKDQFVLEVLDPVPRYSEWKTAKENLDKNGTWYTERSYKRLEKKLEIATKALKEYANSPMGSKYHLTGITACIALKEMEGVK